MNTPRILLAVASLALPMFSANAQWRSDEQPPQISVSGSAEIKVAPDEVDLNVGVESRDENLETAKDDNDKRISNALEFLKQNGVKDKDIQTDFIIIEPVYDNNSGPIDPQTGLPWVDTRNGKTTRAVFYLVRKTIGIKLTNVGSFDTILTGLITNGVNVVRGIDFQTTELRKYKDQARAMAIKAAREKADDMASALGVKVGKPLNISINDWGGRYGWNQGGWGYGGGSANAYQNMSQNAGGGSDENGPTFSVGEISVTANVNVTFLIQ